MQFTTDDVMLARESDFDDIVTIWRMAFFDSDEYIRTFLKMMCRGGNVVVSRVDEKVVSMAFLLECSLVIKGQPYSAYYFYAAATHPDHRNEGHMSRVMQYAIELAKERGIDFVALVPAQASLFDFYARFGFETKFYKKKVRLTREELLSSFSPVEVYDSRKLDIFTTRCASLETCDFLSWDEDAMRYALYEHDSCGGLLAITDDGYAMYHRGKDVVYVKEFCMLSSPDKLYSELLMRETADNFTLNLPVSYPIHSSDEEIDRVGMSLPLNDNAVKAQEIMENAYIGITFG